MNARNAYDETALHRAAEYGTPATIALLIANGADLDAVDSYARTPLVAAAQDDRKEAMNALVEGGADPTAHFVKAAVNGHLAAMRYLRELGADPQATLHQGRTPLHEASAAAQHEAVQFLMEMGANIDAKDANGSTPLHDAARSGDQTTARVLIEAGADPKARDGDGRTPWRLATDLGFIEETVQTILDEGKDADAQ